MIKFKFSEIKQDVFEIMKKNPAECVLSLFLFVVFLLINEKVLDASADNFALSPLFLVATYVLNRILTKGVPRVIYFASALLPLIIIFVDTKEWIGSSALPVSYFLAFLIVVSLKFFKENNEFVAEAAQTLTKAALAMIVIMTAFISFSIINMSTSYLFDLKYTTRDRIEFYIIIVIFYLMAPLVYLYIENKAIVKREFIAKRITEIVLNYVVTPALIVYTVVLYAYIIKIGIEWSLPKGGLSYMVFVFALAAFTAKAALLLVEKPKLNFIYKNLSYILIVPTIVFWAGFMYRVNNYGFTEERFYLLLCGILMSLAILLFTNNKSGRFIYLTVTGAVLFAVFTYIPPITAEKIAVNSQISIINHNAKELAILSDSGKLVIGNKQFTDSASSATFSKIYEAAKYIKQVNGEKFIKERFGIDFETINDLTLTQSEDNNEIIFTVSNEDNGFDINGIAKIYTSEAFTSFYNPDSTFVEVKDSADIVLFKKDFAQLLAAQLERSGYYVPEPLVMQGMKDAMPSAEDIARTRSDINVRSYLNANSQSFLRYEDDKFIMIFDSITLKISDNGKIKISDYTPLFFAVKAN
jgi:hypothetical protein